MAIIDFYNLLASLYFCFPTMTEQTSLQLNLPSNYSSRSSLNWTPSGIRDRKWSCCPLREWFRKAESSNGMFVKVIVSIARAAINFLFSERTCLWPAQTNQKSCRANCKLKTLTFYGYKYVQAKMIAERFDRSSSYPRPTPGISLDMTKLSRTLFDDRLLVTAWLTLCSTWIGHVTGYHLATARWIANHPSVHLRLQSF